MCSGSSGVFPYSCSMVRFAFLPSSRLRVHGFGMAISMCEELRCRLATPTPCLQGNWCDADADMRDCYFRPPGLRGHHELLRAGRFVSVVSLIVRACGVGTSYRGRRAQVVAPTKARAANRGLLGLGSVQCAFGSGRLLCLPWGSAFKLRNGPGVACQRQLPGCSVRDRVFVGDMYVRDAQCTHTLALRCWVGH